MAEQGRTLMEIATACRKVAGDMGVFSTDLNVV